MRYIIVDAITGLVYNNVIGWNRLEAKVYNSAYECSKELYHNTGPFATPFNREVWAGKDPRMVAISEDNFNEIEELT